MNYLLNIAIDKYDSSAFLPLNNAVKDATRLQKVLIDKYGFELIQESLFNQKAIRKNIVEAINNLSSLLIDEDNLIIFLLVMEQFIQKQKRDIGYPKTHYMLLVILFQILQLLTQFLA